MSTRPCPRMATTRPRPRRSTAPECSSPSRTSRPSDCRGCGPDGCPPESSSRSTATPRSESRRSGSRSPRISTGRAWPDGAPCPLGDVVILSAEDGLADTIRPRLDAAGGDPKRVHALTAMRVIDENTGTATTRPPTLADIGTIRTIQRTAPTRSASSTSSMAYLPGRVDSHRDQDVRAVLHRLSEIADESGCTILLLRHLNKSGGGSPDVPGGGSIGIVGAARAGFLVAPDPDDENVRVLACVKSNLAAMPDSLAYRLRPCPAPMRPGSCGRAIVCTVLRLCSTSASTTTSAPSGTRPWLGCTAT